MFPGNNLTLCGSNPGRNQANDLNELKKLQKPSDVIKLIFDCVGLLKMEKVQPVQVDEITIGIGKEKQTLPFLKVRMLCIHGFSDGGVPRHVYI